MNYQPLSITEKRSILAAMIRGQRKAKRYVKQSGRVEEVEEELSAAMLLRAIALDLRLAALEKKEQAAQQVKQDSEAPQPVSAAPQTPAAQPPKQESVKEAFRRKNLERMAKAKAAAKD